MKRFLILLSSASLVLGACSDNGLSTDEAGTSANQALVLTDAAGHEISTADGECGTYYAHIHSKGDWTLSSDVPYIVPLTENGQGDAIVKFIVGNNWQGPRQGQLILTETSAETVDTRAVSSNITRASLSQTGESKLAEASLLLSANKGAGYSYIPNDNYCMGTNMEIFNMGRLSAMQEETLSDLLVDDVYPSTVQQYITSDSEEGLHDKLAISASLSVDFKSIAVKVSGNYDKESTSDKSYTYTMARLKSYYFTREVNFMNISVLAEERPALRDQLYAPGFRKYLDDFIEKIHNAGNNLTETNAICKEFLAIVGPCFISKAVMGCTLDYELAIKTDSLNDKMSVGGALEVSLMMNGVKVEVAGKGQYEDYSKQITRNSQTKVSVRGGDVTKINVLATGGVVKPEDVKEWQQSVKPANCVMVDMSLTPIYAIVFDKTAHDVLKAYFDNLLASN